MEKAMTIVGYVVLAVLLAGLGYVGGRHSAGVVCANSALTTTDTLWEVIHDTCWREVAVNVLRTDTVRLAVVGANVHENGISGTHTDRYGHENGKTGTYRDTLFIHDSVYVEVPIEQKTFVGDNWRVTAHGYRVGLDEVWVNRPTVYVTKTQTKNRRWAFNVGAQIGYGYTIHGGSPYVGLGAGFGYTF